MTNSTRSRRTSTTDRRITRLVAAANEPLCDPAVSGRGQWQAWLRDVREFFETLPPGPVPLMDLILTVTDTEPGAFPWEQYPCAEAAIALNDWGAVLMAAERLGYFSGSDSIDWLSGRAEILVSQPGEVTSAVAEVDTTDRYTTSGGVETVDWLPAYDTAVGALLEAVPPTANRPINLIEVLWSATQRQPTGQQVMPPGPAVRAVAQWLQQHAVHHPGWVLRPSETTISPTHYELWVVAPPWATVEQGIIDAMGTDGITDLRYAAVLTLARWSAVSLSIRTLRHPVRRDVGRAVDWVFQPLRGSFQQSTIAGLRNQARLDYDASDVAVARHAETGSRVLDYTNRLLTAQQSPPLTQTRFTLAVTDAFGLQP